MSHTGGIDAPIDGTARTDAEALADPKIGIDFQRASAARAPTDGWKPTDHLRRIRVSPDDPKDIVIPSNVR